MSYVNIASVWAEKVADLEATPEAEVADALAVRQGAESGYEYAELFLSTDAERENRQPPRQDPASPAPYCPMTREGTSSGQ